MEGKRKVIIDCDPGIDDSLALLLALKSPELEVKGITVVCGNVPTKQGVENTLKVLELTNSLHIPVYFGEENQQLEDYSLAYSKNVLEMGYNFMPHLLFIVHVDAI